MLNVLKIDTQDGFNSYKEILEPLNVSEPYYLLEYIELFSGGLENLICFVLKTETATIIMPGYLNPIFIADKKTEYLDFITPYGYSGPIFSNNTNPAVLGQFWELVDDWYKENNVITEFVRFNLFENQISYNGQIVPTMLNIKGKIIEQELQWSSFDAKVRKNVNKAKRENLSSEIYYGKIEEQKIVEFYNIYIQTMKRTDAKENFFYTLDQFRLFTTKNPEFVAICTIYFEEIAISSELILISSDTIYSFLGGTDDNYFDKRPNDFLKVEALNWARNQNKSYYVLGGGYGYEDGIFKYKKAFFPNDVVSYFTGRKIVNREIYDNLITKASKFREDHGLEKLYKEDDSFFPLYNKRG